MIRSKFAISIHILTLLAKHENQLLSSEKIADSLNMNPALVRRELSALKQKGFLESKEGKGGGVKLSKAPEDIDISDVLDSVKTVHLLGFAKNIPNPRCDVGRNINHELRSLYSEIDRVVYQFLTKYTLSDFVRQFD
ncbi:MAG: transcriptional regulator [Bacteroidetes bacterium]|nr:transcriptional regulator [Bacteroidota bacterium]